MIGIRGVRVLDPANGRDEKLNLVIADGKIVSTDKMISEEDCSQILEGTGLVAAFGIRD